MAETGGILMWGEFPPGTQTGVSVCNEMVLRILKESNIPVFIIDECAWGKNAIWKTFYYLRNYIKLIKTVFNHKIKIVYFVFPLSIGGLIKRFLIWPFLKILSPRTILVGHLHRGDFKKFIQKSILNRVLLKSNFFFINRVIVLSPFFHSEVTRFSRNIEVLVVPNTSPIESSVTNRKYIYTKNFVCISNYIKAKGIQELVECFRFEELKTFRLIIFGETYEKTYLNKIKDLAPENVTVNGPVNRNELSHQLNNYDCLIVPSWNEGQPIIILEAMSLGLPVISTDVGDIPNMLGGDYPFLVKPQNISSLKEAILSFDKFEKKDDLSSMLYERYTSYYSNINFKKQVLKIFM